jgi:hypothetical protein
MHEQLLTKIIASIWEESLPIMPMHYHSTRFSSYAAAVSSNAAPTANPTLDTTPPPVVATVAAPSSTVL